MRSSSSVVTPGWMCRATSPMARAASRQASRMAAIVAASFTSGPSKRRGAGRSTYSGRGMDAGTGRRGPIVPGTSVPSGAVPTRLAPVVVEVAMTSSLSGHPAPSPVGDGEPLTVGEP